MGVRIIGLPDANAGVPAHAARRNAAMVMPSWSQGHTSQLRDNKLLVPVHTR